jgi:hypothetical protein
MGMRMSDEVRERERGKRDEGLALIFQLQK